MKNLSYYKEILFSLLVEKKDKSIVLLFLNFVSAFFEYFTLALIIPYTQLITDYHYGKSNRLLKVFDNLMPLSFKSQGIYLITLVLLVFIFSSIFFRIFTAYYSNSFITKLGVDLSEKLFSNIIKQPYQYNVDINPNYSIATINIKGAQVIYGIIQPIFNLFTSLLLIGAILFSLIWASWKTVLLLGLFFVLFYYLVNRIFSNQISINSKLIAEESGESIKILNETFSGLRYVILNNSYNYFIEKYRKSNLNYLRSQGMNMVISSVPKFLLEGILMVIIVIILLLYFGTSSIEIDIGTIILFAVGSQKLIPIVQQSFFYFNSLKGNIDALKDVLKVLNLKTIEPDFSNNENLTFDNSITFENVSFGYDQNKEILSLVNFKINKGEKIGIVGVSGSGKSTLVDLILGLIKPTQGRILIDGILLSPQKPHLLRGIIGSVPQNVIMNDQTIYENIAFGVPYELIDKNLVHIVAKKANIFSEINKMENGFDSIIGDKGGKLSGGQRQRIGIARALYKKPRILILDEATSAIDTTSEKEILETIYQLVDITVIIITHRIESLEHADEIFKVKDGKIVNC